MSLAADLEILELLEEQTAKDHAPWSGVAATTVIGVPGRPVWSGRQCGQADLGIFAERGDGFQGHVAGALDGPLIGLLEQ
jgi:hypothetical protein